MTIPLLLLAKSPAEANWRVQSRILNNLPAYKIQALNQLYSFQDIYNNLNNMTISGLLNMHFSSNPDDLYRIATFINTTMNDVIELERGLLEFYSVGKTRLTEGEFFRGCIF